MAYSRSTWVKGDVISSARLNNMEQGIVNITNHVDNLNNTDTDSGSSKYVSKVTQTNGQITVEHALFSPMLTLTPGDDNSAPNIRATIAGNISNEIAITKATSDNMNNDSYVNGNFGVTQLCTNTLKEENLSNMTKAVTPLGLWNAINSLDVTNNDQDADYITGFDRGKTLATLTETNGKIAATFQEIHINSAHITDRADGTGAQNIGDTVVKTNAHGIIPSQLLPSYVDDIIEFEDFAHFPSTNEDSDPDDSHTPSGPERGKIYVDLSTGRQYRWSGSQYTETGVIHLNYSDDGNDGDNQSGVANTDYVKSVTQADGQISVVHAAFSPDITWNNAVAGSNDGKPTISITVGGNSDTSLAPNIATTSVYGITKLYDNTDSTSTEMAATANVVKGIRDNIDGLNNADLTAVDSKFVSSVTQVAGQITVSHRDFAPSLSLTEGTTTNAPKVNVTVAGNSMQNPIELTKATVGTTGVYGVTKLSSAINSDDDTIAATPKAIKDAIDSLDIEQITNTAGKTISTIDESNGKVSVVFQDIQITPDQIVDTNSHPLTEWEDITNQCTIANSATAAKVYINRALKLGYFMYNMPSGTANGTQVIKLNPLGNMKLGQYFNSRMDGSMLVAAEIPDKSKTITQNHSANNATTKAFGASGMFMYRDPVNHTLTINYTSTDNQFVAPATYTDSVEEYDTYSHASPVVTYFTPDIATVTGEMGEENVSTTVTYTRSTPTLTVNYVDASDDTVIHAPTSSTKPAGLEYTINAESIEHFTPTAVSITDTMPDHNDSKTFTYNRITHTLTINYVDGNGDALETAYTATVGEALTYSVESPIIEGYSTTDLVVSGTMGNTDTTIDVVYTEI